MRFSPSIFCRRAHKRRRLTVGCGIHHVFVLSHRQRCVICWSAPDARAAKAIVVALCGRQLLDNFHTNFIHLFDDELSYAIACRDFEWLIAMIEQKYFDFSTIVTVNDSRANRDALVNC